MFGLVTLAAGLMPTYLTFALVLPVAGITSMTLMTAANSFVQMAADPAMRGRVLALYMAIFMGGTPAGAPLIGWISEQFGPRWTIGIGAVAVGLALVGVSFWLARSENVRVSYESQRRPRVRVTSVPVLDDAPASVAVPEPAR